MLTGIIAAAAQAFFARRLWFLSHSAPVIVFVLSLALLQCACAIVGSVQVISTKITDSSKLSTFDAFSIWLSTSAACDVAIAGGMIYFLYRRKPNSPTPKTTDYLITRLINYSMQTGLFTAVCAIIDLTLFLRFKTNDLQDTPFLMLAKLYSNTVLANLNARGFLFPDGFQRQHGDAEVAIFTTNVPWSNASHWASSEHGQVLPADTTTGVASIAVTEKHPPVIEAS